MSSFSAGSVSRGWRYALAVLPLALCAGCVRESSNGSELHYQYELWVTPAIMLAGVAGLAGGWFIRRRSQSWAWALMVLGAIGLLAGPSKLFDKVVVSEQGFHVRVGIVGLAKVHDVKFDNIREIKLISEVSGGRRRSTSYYMVCDLKDGGVAKISLNDLTKAALAPILQKAGALNIPVVNAT